MRATSHDPHAATPERDAAAPFEDRFDAGEQLSAELRPWLASRMIDIPDLRLVGVTDGGLPLAYLASLELAVELEPAPMQPIHAPHQRSLRIGMVVDDGYVYIDRATGERHGARGSTLDHLIDRAEQRLWLQMDAIDDRAGADVAGRDVLIVDDAIDTGLTILGCADWLRRWGARRVYAAVAVGTERGLERAGAEVDGLLCLHQLEDDVPPGSLFADAADLDDDRMVKLVDAIRLLNMEHRHAG
jgi:predicted phosphoribosyltransferase